jgi:hypothetical protein
VAESLTTSTHQLHSLTYVGLVDVGTRVQKRRNHGRVPNFGSDEQGCGTITLRSGKSHVTASQTQLCSRVHTTTSFCQGGVVHTHTLHLRFTSAPTRNNCRTASSSPLLAQVQSAGFPNACTEQTTIQLVVEVDQMARSTTRSTHICLVWVSTASDESFQQVPPRQGQRFKQRRCAVGLHRKATDSCSSSRMFNEVPT